MLVNKPKPKLNNEPKTGGSSQPVQPLQSSIFITQTEINDSDVSGKLTYTNIQKSIPQTNRYTEPLTDWKNTYNTEWRWRFLSINLDNGSSKDVVEISYVKKDSNKRIYYNRYCQEVVRTVDPIYDQFVTEEYYVYT